MNQNLELPSYSGIEALTGRSRIVFPSGREKLLDRRSTAPHVDTNAARRWILVIGLGALTLTGSQLPSYLNHFIHYQPTEVSAQKEAQQPERIAISVSPEYQHWFDEQVSKYTKLYKNDTTRINNTLRWKDTVEQIVEDKLQRFNIPEQSKKFWINRMLEIIFVESEGLPDASSGVAFGLTQLKPSTASEVATQHKIRNPDIYIGWDNITLGLGHQLNMAKRYGNQLSTWVHHLGYGNTDLALRAYLVSVLKLPVDEVEEVIFRNPDPTAVRKYIDKYEITPEKLLDSPAVTAKLKEKEINAFNDDTQFYRIRLKAAGQTMGLTD